MAYTLALPRHSSNNGSIFNTLIAWQRRAQQRRALARLDADGLKDIGITAQAARSEANRPFWL